jgi:hypothetical protein
MFVLHSNAVPDLPAGGYTVRVRQTITAPDATTQALDSHLEVTAPRWMLPADQVLSTFPPNQAAGAFSSRLPQIVLRRRTLPWERGLDGRATTSPLPREIPWLALVVLADAECEYRGAKPIADCITKGVVLEGRNDAATGASIVVTDEVVRQVFPTKQELPLLAHVREVDLSDTELALGDDDGWLAVVLSNRLPQPGVRYRACLISLEGQYGELADAAPVAEEFSGTFVYEQAALDYDLLSYEYAHAVDQAKAAPTSGKHAAAGRSATVADAWSTATTASGTAETWQAHNLLSGGTARLVGAMHGVSMGVIAPAARQLTFPVLATWQFTCTGAGDFQSLVQGLDVGMLGTPPEPPPPPGPGERPAPPATRPPPEVLDTGHVTLGHTSRDGESGSVWYRGPLVPRPTSRQQPDARGHLALAHASDHLRRVGPDGRENLSLAAAFEIGRLLALAEPSVVAALLNWRKEGFEQARREALLEREPTISVLLATVDTLTGFAAGIAHQLIADLGADGAARLGPVRPPTDPSRPVAGIDDADLVELLATGLGVAPETVRDLVSPGVRGRPPLRVPVADQLTDADRLADAAEHELAPLRAAALDTAATLAAGALRDLPPGPAAPTGADALDRLLTPGEEPP